MSAPGGYTVKERVEQLATTIADQFTSIIRQLDAIESKIDGKASTSRVDALERRIDVLDKRLSDEVEKRLVQIELRAAGIAAVSTFQRWLVGGIVVVGAGSISALIYLAAGGH